jgi:hypothetical protein
MRRYGRGGPWFGFPIGIAFMVLIFSHSFQAFISTIIVLFIVSMIARTMFNTGGNAQWWQQSWGYRGYQQPPQQQTPYYQPPQQQRETPYYQPSQQQEQQSPVSYDQGYRSPQSAPKETSASSFDDFEQPQAQYPEQQLPPMTQ